MVPSVPIPTIAKISVLRNWNPHSKLQQVVKKFTASMVSVFHV